MNESKTKTYEGNFVAWGSKEANDETISLKVIKEKYNRKKNEKL